MVLKNGIIHPITSDEIHGGYIYIKSGKILNIGTSIPKTMENKNIPMYDLKGKHILPGFIDAHTHLGILEESVGEIGQDNNETSNPVTPHLRAIDGVNPNDVGFADAVRAGVTCVMTGPGSNNAVGGLNIAIKTYGNIIDKMVLKDPAGFKIAFGENPMTTYGSENSTPVTRMGIMALIRSLFMRAEDYKKEKEKGNISFRDPALEAALLAINQDIPIRVHAHRADDIVTAIRLADEFNLRMTIEHGTEAHLIKDYLKEKNIAIAIGPILTPRIKIELKNRSYITARELAETGIKISLITDHPYNSIEHLRLAAILAHQEGLPERIALEAITINPAGILNVEDRVGSLKEGKDADIVVMNGHPLDIYSKVELVFIDGEVVYKDQD